MSPHFSRFPFTPKFLCRDPAIQQHSYPWWWGGVSSQGLLLCRFLQYGLHDVATKRMWAGCDARVKPWAGELTRLPGTSAILKYIYLFYVWLHWVLGAASSLQRAGFSLVVAQGLWAWASVVVAFGLSLLQGMWALSSQTGDWTPIPALEGGFLTTGLPGKSRWNL